MKICFRLFCYVILSLFVLSCSEKTEISHIPLKENGGDFYFHNSNGARKFEKNFAYAGAFRDGLAIVKLIGSNEQYVYLNEKGEIAINKDFKNISVFSENLAWVAPRNQHPTAINKNGNKKFSIENAERVRLFKEGLAAFSTKDSIDEKWGFVNSEGKTIIQPQFRATGDFNNGICAVMNEDFQWGFIDKKGKIIIDYKFDFASNYSENKAIIVSSYAKFGVINTNGEYLIEPVFDSIVADKENYLVKQNKKWHWIDNTGKSLFKTEFEEANPFYNQELAVVKQNGLYGYIDKKGIVKINFQFAKAHPFMGDVAYAITKNSNKGSLINKEGKIVVKDNFSAISEDLIAYLNNGKSSYEMIETDYFDIKSILKNINLNTPEGLSFNDEIRSIVPKFFNKNIPLNTETDVTISCLKKISADGYLSSYIIRDENDSNKIAGFWYKIEIADGRNFYKPHDLEKALIKSLKGYTKIEAPNAFINQNRIKAFKNDQHFLLITGDATNNKFIIEVLNLAIDFENFNSRSYSNYQNTDTDDSSYRSQRMLLLNNDDNY